ncbi:MAG: hypothetical protein AB1422_03890 [bacterium]
MEVFEKQKDEWLSLDIQVFLRLSGLSFFNRKERKEINRKERRDYRLFTTLLIPSLSLNTLKFISN